MRILLVRLSALGDVVTGLHVLSTLAARDCSARLGWLVERRFADLIEGHPQIDVLHVYERGHPGRLVRLVSAMRRERYDLALDLQGNLKSGLLTRLSGAKRRMGLGRPLSREGNRFFVRELVEPPAGHRIDAYHALVDAALGEGGRARGSLPVTAQPHGSIVLHPGVSRFGLFKKWPAKHFAALGDLLAGRLDAPVALTAGPGERAAADEVASRMRTPARIEEPGSLTALAGFLAGARLVVAGDTGPAHIAAAVGVPALTLFGPKDPAVNAPVGARAKAVRAGVRCSPCALRSCPDPVCMSQLSVERVAGAAMELLA